MAPRKINRKEAERTPDNVWNEYIHLLARSAYAELTDVQRAAHLVFWYESEVQNGGHLQYFENQGVGQIAEVVTALKRLGGDCQAGVLSAAHARFTGKPRKELRSITEYVE